MALEEVRERLKRKWENLPPEERKKLVTIAVVILVVLVSYLAYVSTRGHRVEKKEEKKAETKEITLETDLLKRSYYVESMKRYEELKKELEKLKEELKKKEKEITAVKERKEREKKKPEKVSPVVRVPPPPPVKEKPAVSKRPPAVARGKKVPPSGPQVMVVGDIAIVETGKKEGRKVEKKEVIKKKYYLPPSFMEATLLSGLDAPAIRKGKGNPVPCLFRIKAPAVLPNRVKANLKGCFVIGEALGNLATERADIRLVSLSCIDRKGKAVIDQRVKGFVVDNDGKIGLRGRVVSKMGATIARALLAGLASGIGRAFGYQAYTYTYSPEGTLIVPEEEKIAKAAIGGGISQAAEEIQKFYLDLAKQTVPVVEILATRNVTLVISEGTWLELKNYEAYK